MSKSRQFYIYKFKSARLKEFNYNITLNYKEAQEYGELIALFDNQMLRSIRKINNQFFDEVKLNELELEKKRLTRSERNEANIQRLEKIRNQIIEMTFIPEYIVIEMSHTSHYKYLFENKLILNNKTYKRFSCSAGQARTSTVVFVDESIVDELDNILNNGRNKNRPLVPSKFNAYKGVYGSATQSVSTPRFALVPDYYSETEVKVNYVTETENSKDDLIEYRMIKERFNRFDGQGLISYEQSAKWAKELGLDHVPAQWCVRNSFLKGMLCTFPIHQFCEEVNGGNTLFNTSYKDENGNIIKQDMNNVDVIISESMLKLWDSFTSIEEYQDNCKKNGLSWGVSLYTPKQDKDILKMNYQYLQTLNLSKQDIEKICDKFVKWITGVSSENVYYTMLFLLGNDVNESKIMSYLVNGDNHWARSLILNPKLIHDKYIKKKIYELLKRKIKNGCLGQILVDGNFQTIVSDPYAMMQHIMGLEVTGLLGTKKYYSNYWNKKGVTVVDSMRSPLTYRSEHVILDLEQNEELDKWYRYCYSGILVNVHGHETMNWAGSDFDYDILATTSDKTIIKSVFRNELPVFYVPPKSESKVFTEQDLYNADTFSFGSIIGSITNKSTSAFALLPTLEENSLEWETTINRIKMCTKLQSAQIDKAKIGKEVKGIPSSWVDYQKVLDTDVEEVKLEKEFTNSIMLDKHPYFFIYLYKGTRNKYKKHYQSYNITCQQKFGYSLDELRNHKRLTLEQKEFLNNFYKYSPVIDSDCVMNNVCKYIESVDFQINNVLKDHSSETYKLILNENYNKIDENTLKRVEITFNTYKKVLNQLSSLNSKRNQIDLDEDVYLAVNGQQELLKQELQNICSNDIELVNYLIHLFYVKNPDSNKDVLWNMFGDILFENVKAKTKEFYIPVESINGDINYLNKNYTLRKVIVDEEL